MQRDAAAEAVLALLHSRQSVAPKRLVLPGPSPGEIEAIVRAAGSAPDHGALYPFRMIRVADESRQRLADLFVEAKRRRMPEAAAVMFDREREKALNAPTLLVACARLREDLANVPVVEQLISAGASIQGVLLAAYALGFGAILLSGEKARDPLVRAAFGLAADEMLIGFIGIGTIHPSHSPLQSRNRRAVETYLSTWTGPSSLEGLAR